MVRRPRRLLDIAASRVVDTSPERVMALIRDATTWSRWQPEIVAADGPKHMAAGDVARGRARMLGFHVEGHSTALEAREDAFDEDVLVGVRLRVRYEARPDGGRTIVTHRVVSELPSGPLGTVLALALRWRLRKMQRATLEQLASHAVDS